MASDRTVLAQCRRLVSLHFAFLREDFGFHEFPSGIRAPECWVALRNATTGVTVIFVLGEGPWVEVARLALYERRVVEAERYSLDFLLMERAQHEEIKHRCEELSDPRVAQSLSRQARQLRTYAEDILRGDFQIFPRLKARAEENARQKEREVFGGGR